MEIKKNAQSKLENYSKFFMLLGLLWAFLITYLVIEYKNERYNDLTKIEYYREYIDDNEDIPITKSIEDEANPNSKTILDIFDAVVDDSNIKETIITTTDIGVDDPVMSNRNLDNIIEVNIKETDEETVPFIAIEEVPTYPGCTGSNETKKECFISKLSKFIYKEFNANIAQELGLPSGKQRVFVMFIINKNGNITNIEARAPHKSLEKEAIRVIESLPKMIPGRQFNKAVAVKYSLPITYNVE